MTAFDWFILALFYCAPGWVIFWRDMTNIQYRYSPIWRDWTTDYKGWIAIWLSCAAESFCWPLLWSVVRR